jgi:hypothetical protein
MRLRPHPERFWPRFAVSAADPHFFGPWSRLKALPVLEQFEHYTFQGLFMLNFSRSGSVLLSVLKCLVGRVQSAPKR